MIKKLDDTERILAYILISICVSMLGMIVVMHASDGKYFGVDKEDPNINVRRLDNIVRVLKNSNSYTVYIQNPGSKELEQATLFLDGYSQCEGVNQPRIVTDAREDQSVWAEYVSSSNIFCDVGVCGCLLSLHLHEPREINGGTWDHGKFGNGPIHVIE